MRVALIGYGSVAAIHARVLREHAELVTVCGPDEKKAETFAQLHGISRADGDLRKALGRADAAIICSPSAWHFRQGSEALENGVHTLIELPACDSAAEAQSLAALADSSGLALQCAHTSRYLEPYRHITTWIHDGTLGEIRHVHYLRSIAPRSRSWTDDALLHHAEHPLDLFLHWFGSVKALGCAAHPGIPGAQDISLVASVFDNVPVAVSISYTSRLPEVKLTIIGSEHTIATDGFTYISSDEPGLRWRADERQVYERAIEEQDVAFLRACDGGGGGVPWRETVRLTQCVWDFVTL